jgi:hypothetical protein
VSGTPCRATPAAYREWGYAGQQIEISIVFATDWSIAGNPGVLIDDTSGDRRRPAGRPDLLQEDTGGWTVPGAHPAGPSTNVNDWIRSQRIFEDAAVTKSDFGLFFGSASRAWTTRQTVPT